MSARHASAGRADTLTSLAPDDTLAVLVHGHHFGRAEARRLMNDAARSDSPVRLGTAELTARHGPGGVRYDVHDLGVAAVDWLLAVRAYGLATANQMFPATGQEA